MQKLNVLFEGIEYSLYYADDAVADTVKRTGQFMNHADLAAIKNNVTNFNFVLDVGGNLGQYSFFFKNVCNSEKVIAFDPFPPMVELFKLNNPDIEIHQVALSNKRDILRFYDPAALGNNTGVGQVHENGNLVVQAYTLDSYNFQGVTLIKIDVEGHELEVLEGAVDTLRRCKPSILLEHHSKWPGVREREVDFNKFYEYIPQGYKHIKISEENYLFIYEGII